MKRFSSVVLIWLLLLGLCAVAVVLAFAHVDVPLARYFWSSGRFLRPLGGTLGAAVILSMESAIVLVLILTRLVRGRSSPFRDALLIACLTSISSYAVNSYVLKVLFGVPPPMAVMHGVRHTFNFWMGAANSSFPSGHMVLAGAFAGVLMRLYRVSIWPLAALLLLAAGLMVFGGWHFLSDVIAGSFIGLSAGVLAGEAWARS